LNRHRFQTMSLGICGIRGSRQSARKIETNKQKMASAAKPRPFRLSALKGRRVRLVVRFRSIGTGGVRTWFRFAAVKLANHISANRPRRDLRGIALLAFTVRLLVCRADEAALDEDVSAFLDGRRNAFGQDSANTTTRCHSTFELHSSSAFFHERCVAIDSTVNFEPLPFA
jgi:hypothetical protein